MISYHKMSSTPHSQPRRSSNESKKITPPTSTIVTRNEARKSKVQTRAMSAGVKPSASLVAAKKKAQQRNKKKASGDVILKDHYHIAMGSKENIRKSTGYVTDLYMLEHHCLWDSNYPECPSRLSSVTDRISELGLRDQCKVIESRLATENEIYTMHSTSVYEMLKSTDRNGDEDMLEKLSSKYDAIYMHPSTQKAALLAAGSTIELVEQIVRGKIQNGMAVIRPPGHHAMKDEPCGYCFYNNVALGARHALDNLGLNRILIVDWDVHHGQGTQQMFYDDSRVVYFSVHRYEHGSFWPNLRQSDFDFVGCGSGRGRNINVPLNETGMTDGDYLAIWHQLLLPIAYEFQPELVLVSAGYDAAVGCPEGEMEVTPACYATLTHMIMGVCSSVCVVLEGGYCLSSLAEGAALTLRTLLGHPPPRLTSLKPPCQSICDTILNCIYAHKQYWHTFKYQPKYSIKEDTSDLSDWHAVKILWLGDETVPEAYATRNCYPVQSQSTIEEICKKLNRLRMVTDLTVPTHPVCYAYDLAMLKHRNICEPGHVECPERIMRIHERHREYGLLDRVHQLSVRCASDVEILAVHSEQHLKKLKDLATTKLRDLNSNTKLYDSIYFHPDSLESAAVAAGSVIEMVDAVLNGLGGCGVCVVRPPGHHADEDVPSGFCLLNNAAIAARHALNAHTLQRILLVDWDVHHGNGTQRIFYNEPEVLYISLHRYDNGSFFPYSSDANYTRVGSGPGEGYNVNIPWNKRGMSDLEYLTAFTQIVLPIAYEYNPQLVIVSAGFDACVGDPLGGCKVSPECYGQMTHMLRVLAGGRVVLCLEGGYNITSTSYAMTMCTKALLGDPLQRHYDPDTTCHISAVETINNVIRTHKKYWKNLRFQVALPLQNILDTPPPSRGLIVSHNGDNARATSSFSSLNDSSNREYVTSFGSSSEGNIDSHFAELNLDPKCEGGNCGTDDEEESKPCKSDQGQSGNASAGCSSSNKSDSNVQKETLVDYLAQRVNSLVNEDMFAVVPMPWCPHLDSLFAIPENVDFAQDTKCVSCDHTEENWVCLHCYVTACARHINGHMQEHCHSTGHTLVLSLYDLSVWCNICDAYVDNPLLYDAKNKAHIAKFNESMPWCYPRDTLQLH